MNDLGSRILARRTMLGLRQQDLARIAGLSISYMSMVERGDRTPYVRTLEKLARALQTTVSALLTEDCAKGTTDSVESLVAYLHARNAIPEQVRRVEALARVLLEAA